MTPIKMSLLLADMQEKTTKQAKTWTRRLCMFGHWKMGKSSNFNNSSIH